LNRDRGRRASVIPGSFTVMDTVLDRPWTIDTFLLWEDQQEGKHEFDGRTVIPMTGGTVAHQTIVFNLLVVLNRLLADRSFRPLHEMRLRAGTRIRYPDAVVCAGPLDQATRTLVDATAIFEVLSDDTAVIDRVEKLIDYAAVPSVRCYVLLEQTTVAATFFQREPGGAWIATAHTDGVLVLPGLDITMPLADLYQGLNFAS
jgi:Uma2 family endonuclease